MLSDCVFFDIFITYAAYDMHVVSRHLVSAQMLESERLNYQARLSALTGHSGLVGNEI